MLMKQLNASRTVIKEQPNQLYVMSDLNKSISSYTGHETGQVSSDWLKEFIGMADINKWSGALQIESAHANLSEPAQQWFESRFFVTCEDFER